MKIKNQEIKITAKTNIDEEIKKAKELVSLLERANKLIQSLNNLKITKKAEEKIIIFNHYYDIYGVSETLNKQEAINKFLDILENEEVEEINIKKKWIGQVKKGENNETNTNDNSV